MKTIIVDGMPVEVSDAAHAAITKLQGTVAKMTEDATAAATKHASEISQRDGQIGTLTAEVKTLKDAAPKPADLSRMVAERTALAAVAKDAGVEVKDDMDNAAIRRAVVTKTMGDEATKDVSDDVVSGMFKVVSSTLSKKGSDGGSDTFRDAVRNRQPAATETNDDDPSGQQAYEDRVSNAWQGGTQKN